jgi:hypothetical protein
MRDWHTVAQDRGLTTYEYWDLKLRLVNLYLNSEGNNESYFRLKAETMKGLGEFLLGPNKLWEEFTEGVESWKEFKDGTTETSE